ncbi:MAG: response regulator [Actinomycetota bacterium]|nr:response regulator [Actinomycetota bacterium]
MRKLLIADDEEGVRSLVRMTLNVDSYEILEARDGNEALEVARRERPDIVLLDVMMPGQSGVEVCRALKADRATAGTSIILLTAKAQEEDRAEGLAAGADDYFTKPFSPLGLIAKVEEALERVGS